MEGQGNHLISRYTIWEPFGQLTTSTHSAGAVDAVLSCQDTAPSLSLFDLVAWLGGPA